MVNLIKLRRSIIFCLADDLQILHFSDKKRTSSLEIGPYNSYFGTEFLEATAQSRNP